MAEYVIGIDLGTTNSVVAYAPLSGEKPEVQLLPIPQLTAAGTVENLTVLPSFLYLATEAEAAGSAYDVLSFKGRDNAVGELARRQSAEVPQRTVVAAKSWLCHSRVDRHQPILPWGAPDDVAKVSPVAATRRFLEHMVAAWHAAFPKSPIGLQQVVLTVPASFDASARELTREAALAAGLPENFVLLEEPQAAVYAWLNTLGDKWRRQLSVGDVLLVCDVGGGTTDLTLVGVSQEAGELVLRRIAVGNHLLVGGDNMDLALAHHVAGIFSQQGTQLDPWQSVSLWHACRAAKEALLSVDGPVKQPIAIKGRGSKLIKGTISVDVDRAAVAKLLVDGFLPDCELNDRPAKRRVSGFQEIGLPYESDTAITRHLAAFLGLHGGDKGPIQPTHILFNGGVFKSESLRQQLLDVIHGWFGGENTEKSESKRGKKAESKSESGPKQLAGNSDLDHAVAIGAACYAWAKEHGGVRIRGGTARSYYVGIETAGLAVPGAPRPLRALCVAPLGMEEGTEADVPSGEIGLVVGEPAHFRFFSSAVRKQDKPGTLVDRWTDEEMSETDALEATLSVDESIQEPYVPVKFHSRITELGMFELWCVGTKNPGRWKLEFSVRDAGDV